jgi:2,4-dienoyl-CoA reductase-like NADH-dependent reductase (Old Yellow Enzyme family)
MRPKIENAMCPTPTHFPDCAADAPLFEPLALRNALLPNRFVRSATYEGLGAPDGHPLPALGELYAGLVSGGVGTVISGFAFVSQSGRAMQPGQCGIHVDNMVDPWSTVVARVRSVSPDARLFLQLAHAGRQTRQEATGLPVVGVSRRACRYFRSHPHVLADADIEGIVDDFAQAARRARAAGFDGVQVHAAHGYLVHQFLSPWTNLRRDRWADRPLFLEEVIRRIRGVCGDGFAVLVKLSWSEDRHPGITLDDTRRTLARLERLDVDAVEVSVGTMEEPLNIIRGACPVAAILDVNPLFARIPRPLRALWTRFCLPAHLRRQIPFSEGYNLEAAVTLARATRVPIFAVGGLRSVATMREALARGVAAVSLCRPLIRTPDLPRRVREGLATHSTCSNCNLCTVHCDGPHPLRCRRTHDRPAAKETRPCSAQPHG